MEQVKWAKDGMFSIGLAMFILGYLVLVIYPPTFFFASTSYLTGLILIVFSQRSWRVKILFIPIIFLNLVSLRWIIDFFHGSVSAGSY